MSKTSENRVTGSKLAVAGLGLSFSVLVFALGAPSTTRIFSGQEVDADPLPPAQPHSTPSIVSSSDPSNPLFNACGLFGTSPYTVNVNSNYDLSNCFGSHPSGQAPSFTTSGCNGVNSDGSFTPSAQVASCSVSAQIPASGNNLASPPTILDLTIAGALQPQTIAQASGDPALPDSSAPLYNSNTHTISLTGASSDLDFEINALDTSNCSAQVSGTSVVVTSNIASGNGQCRIEVFAQRDPANSVAESARLPFDIAVSALLSQPTNVAITVPGETDVSVGGAATSPVALQNQAGSGVITWSVSADSAGICTIDSSTGVVTPGSTAGTCEVIASIAATSQYAAQQVGPVGFTVNAYSAPTASAAGLVAQTLTPLIDFEVDTSSGFEFTNVNASVTYSATLSGGSALPSWLSIDSSTGVITGIAPVGLTSTDLEITVDDGLGGTFAQTQTITGGGSVPTGALATYQAADTLNGNTYEFRSWRDDHPGVTFPSKISVSNGRYVSFSTTPDNANTRLDPADMLTLLNATNLTSPASDPNGLRDVNGNLITIASDGAESAGYLVVGIGPRTDSSWQHGLLQVVPITGIAHNDHVSTGTSQTTTPLYVANKPYGLIADTVSDATGAVEISGTVEVGQSLTVDLSNFSDPDGFNLAGSTDLTSVSYQWLSGGQAISGQTGNSLVLSQAMQDEAISVRVSYTDSAFFDEVHTSAQTSSVTLPADASSLLLTPALSAADLRALSIPQQVVSNIENSNNCGEDFDENCLDVFNSARSTSSCVLADVSSPSASQAEEYVGCVIGTVAIQALGSLPTSFTESAPTGTTSCSTAFSLPLPTACRGYNGYSCTITSQPTQGDLSITSSGTAEFDDGFSRSPDATTVNYGVRVDVNRYSLNYSYSANYAFSLPQGGVPGRGTVVTRRTTTGNVNFASLEHGTCGAYPNYTSNFDADARLATKAELRTALGGSFANQMASGKIVFRTAANRNVDAYNNCNGTGSLPVQFQEINNNGTTGSQQSIRLTSSNPGSWAGSRPTYMKTRTSYGITDTNCYAYYESTPVIYACTNMPVNVCE